MNRPVRIRSALFTSGTTPELLSKAVRSRADVCIFDLEDSVPAAGLSEAREAVGKAVAELASAKPIWVRVHAPGTGLMAADVASMPLDRIAGVMVPKLSGRHDIEACRTAIAEFAGPLDLPIAALIESSEGVIQCLEIARAPGICALALGRFDLSAELRIDPDSESAALNAARAALVLASAACGLPPPLDSPWLPIDDLDGLRRAAERARRDGFGGMLLIHPSHIAVANEVFTPRQEDLEWARSVVEGAARESGRGKGAFQLGGEMVDGAIVRRARRILEQAGNGC